MKDFEAEPHWIAEELEAVFTQIGQRQSGPRQLLLELLGELARTGQGFTADELWTRMRQKDGVGRATVFRTLKSLVEHEVLDQVEFPDGTRLYRVCGERVAPGHAHHHHLACSQCHKIVTLTYCFDSAALEQIAHNAGFQIAGHSITLYGLCQDCQTGTVRSVT